MAKKPAHVIIKPRGKHDTPQRMIKRFIKKVKKYKIVEKYRETMRYEKPSEKRRKQRKNRDRLIKKTNEENKEKQQTNYNGRR
jgi:ribosomal protein S21